MKDCFLKYDDFSEVLQDKYGYRTPDHILEMCKKDLLFKYDFWYYVNLLKVVYDCSKLAREGKLDSHEWACQSLNMFQLIEHAGTPVNISGVDNLEILKKQPCVLVSNHMSIMETFMLPCIFLNYGFGTYVLKESLTNYPYFKDVLKAIDPISVKRENPREDLKKVLTDGVKKLGEGTSLIIFPQSTRNVVLDKSQFNTLGHKLAARANVPVIPVAIKTDFFGKGKIIAELSKIDRSKDVYIKFGEPILNVKEDSKGAYEKTFRFIADSYRSWGGEVKE
ncbi:MAG: lysophospholipid acyltransferase family protein [Kiritimatiellae bacterium]|jgi:1-acyl-sn-glycerol-3-phosphate acyltransferase|nr:lysophospholipid acyltransferase family protein [Kiritimatiellia bacterium]